MSQKKKLPLWGGFLVLGCFIGTIVFLAIDDANSPKYDKRPPPREKTALQKELDEQLYRAIENEHDPVLRSY